MCTHEILTSRGFFWCCKNAKNAHERSEVLSTNPSNRSLVLPRMPCSKPPRNAHDLPGPLTPLTSYPQPSAHGTHFLHLVCNSHRRGGQTRALRASTPGCVHARPKATSHKASTTTLPSVNPGANRWIEKSVAHCWPQLRVKTWLFTSQK